MIDGYPHEASRSVIVLRISPVGNRVTLLFLVVGHAVPLYALFDDS